jgi:NhaP-type Na+/H+ or K+/H+ antiporter
MAEAERTAADAKPVPRAAAAYTFAFAYVGLSLWSSNFLGSAFVFALATLLALVLARLITVFGLCKLLSIFGGSKFELPLSEQLGNPTTHFNHLIT